MNTELVKKYGVEKTKGEILFCEFEPGNTVFFVQSGSVRLTKIVGDREKSLAVIQAGDIFGEMSILENAPRSATAIAETDCHLLEFNIESFSQLVKAQPSIAIKLLKSLAIRIEDQRRKFKIINLPDNECKIMDTFLMLAEKKGINPETDQGTNVLFEVEISDIATWSGLPGNLAAQKLDEMRQQSKINKTPKAFKIPNLYQFFRHVLSKRQSMEADS